MILERYYSEDDQIELGLADGRALEARLAGLRDVLVQRASVANPHLADTVRNARRSGRWTKGLVDFLVAQAETDHSRPRREDPLGAWFRPRLVQALALDWQKTLGDLIDTMSARGCGWWKPVPRIGQGKAAALERWLRRHGASLGELPALVPAPVATDLVVLNPEAPELVTYERIALPHPLSGHDGANRSPSLPLISARDDLEAIEAYLYKHRANPKTQRSYQKELERFLLWSVLIRRKTLSSVLVDDCEAFKDFLAQVPAAWIGPRARRHSPTWRPFNGQLSPESQGYAVTVVTAFFEWLVRLRYLAGNPWIAVAPPAVAKRELPLQVEKALPEGLWNKLQDILDGLCGASAAELASRWPCRGGAAGISLPAQFRAARAALLLLGDAGLRREEAAGASRNHLRPVPGAELWELSVLGKGNKWRTVMLPPWAVDALAAHFADRGEEFDFGLANVPLVAPLVQLQTRGSRARQEAGGGRSGYTGDGIYKLVQTALKRIADSTEFDLTDLERQQLRQATPHAFRHTFGTLSIAQDVPADVLQRAMGHASLATTTIYVHPEKQRQVAAFSKFFHRPSKA